MPTLPGSRGSSGRSSPLSVSRMRISRTRGRLRDGRTAIRPRALRLDLRGKREQGALVVRAADQLSARAAGPAAVKPAGMASTGWPVAFHWEVKG